VGSFIATRWLFLLVARHSFVALLLVTVFVLMGSTAYLLVKNPIVLDSRANPLLSTPSVPLDDARAIELPRTTTCKGLRCRILHDTR